MVVVILLLLQSGIITPMPEFSNESPEAKNEKSASLQLYEEMQLDGVINVDAFDQAMEGYQRLNPDKKDIITLIDYSKPSTEERLYVIDITHKKLLFKSHVAHGRNSGANYARSFSNLTGSYKSSLGFYLTENTYQGANGYSLILNGLERGINDNAKQRAIVMHGADYCNPAITRTAGRLGRSLGCPALPRKVCKSVIDTIKGGTLLFIYADNPQYTQQSPILSPHYNMLAKK